MIDKSDPFIRRVRSDMAEVYRNVREDKPAIARLLFKREQKCAADLRAYLWNGAAINPLLPPSHD